MNRSGRGAAGVMQQNWPVQQMQMMMIPGGNPTCWWNTTGAAPANFSQQHQQLSSSSSSNLLADNNSNFELLAPPQVSSNSLWQQLNDHTQLDEEQHHLCPADSWSQLLMNGVMMSGSGDQEKSGDDLTVNHIPSSNWEENHHQMMQYHPVKQEINCHGGGSYPPMHGAVAVAVAVTGDDDDHTSDGFHVTKLDTRSWPNTTATAAAVSSPQTSCVTFSTTTTAARPPAAAGGSSECKDSSAATTGGTAVKKAKVQSTSSPSTFKVRKFGDRITALHQLVSPFGKTDTASVLLEAIGYIRFLQSQIEALSLPYLTTGNGSVNNKRRLRPHVHDNTPDDQRNCLFPEHPGQLLNDNSLKRKASARHDDEQPQEEAKKDLRSRGLCLVPISCTLQVGSESSVVDYWAPTAFGGFGR